MRPWWITAALLLIVSTWFVSSSIARSSRGRKLTQYGIKGTALIVSIDGEALPKKIFDPDPRRRITLEVHLPGRPPYPLESVQIPDNRQTMEVKTEIPIYVDPADPTRFTTRTEYSLQDDLLVGMVLSPVILLLAGVAVVIRQRLLWLWRSGQAAVAVVVETSQSPVAPFSHMVRFTLRDHRNSQVFSILVPNRFGRLERGDNVWVVVHLDRPSRAVMAGLYS